MDRRRVSREKVGSVTSPEVRLSPNARNFVRDSRGVGAVTVTSNVQDVDCAAASVAVHCTVVVPTGKSDPDCRVQLTCTGGTPPAAVGGLKVTATGVPRLDVDDEMLDGQLTAERRHGRVGG